MAPSVTGYEIRDRLDDLLVRDLHGPWDGDSEELPPRTSPGERYLLGKLVPRRDDADEPTESDDENPEDDDVETRPELVDEGGLDLDPDTKDDRPSTAAVRGRAMAASSVGLAFTVATDVEAVRVTASWGRYERGPSAHHQTETGKAAVVWHRMPTSGEVVVPTDVDTAGTAVPVPEQDGVLIRWRVRHRGERRVVEVFLLNVQAPVQVSPDTARLFQVALTVTAVDGAGPVFCGHNDPALPPLRHETDDELALLVLQHRHQREYAVGRQCAVDADVRPDEVRAWRLITTCFPATEIRPVVAGEVGRLDRLELDMTQLGSPELAGDELAAALIPLMTGYRAWLAEQARRLDDDEEIVRHAKVAHIAMGRARQIADRLERAVDLLRTDPVAREAFRFANQAMARQRLRSELVRARPSRPEASVDKLLAELNVPANRSWRPFQLAFVLLCLPGLTDPAHLDAKRGPLTDGQAQLLFFPTGGGKTEAYLGLTAYTIAIRRLQGQVGDGADARDGTRGIGVLMRYTLRLLTAQQFQRATALIAACELLRQERVAAHDKRWGDTPIRIGLWVGSAVTPNSYDEAARQLEDATGAAAEGQTGGLQQFSTCPWCGNGLSLGRDGQADRVRRRILLYCGDPDGRCAFSRARSTDGLPVLVVDEEIYRLVPDLLIGTVDKFAALPWRGDTAHLFGHVTTECDRHGFRPPDTAEWCKAGGHPRAGTLPATAPVGAVRLRPPDLVIQDELHLISDALGSMVGLYETLVDGLCTRRHAGVPVRPVLVASTATVRRAKEQVQQVFARDLAIFPPPLLDAGATWFSRPVDPTPDRPGRRYRGIMAPGERLTAVEIRVVTALLEYGQHLLDGAGEGGGAAVDPYLTVVDYFTSTRELAGMRRLVDDDIAQRLTRREALTRRRSPAVAELTSRMDSRKITQSLADIERRFEWRYDSTDGQTEQRRQRREDEKAWDAQARKSRPVDVLLATSMLQVGVDVPRLGLMVVTGQPKNMAEYIQASSRVGRTTAGPGLVVTIYQWNRPRDLAHYEAFGYEHATFGRRVEGLTTTPYSARALDRGLAGVLVGAIRHATDAALPNLGAHIAHLGPTGVEDLLEALRRRAELVTESAPAGQDVADRARHLVDSWVLRRTQVQGGQLGYQAGAQAGAGLLRRPGDASERWSTWHAPLSLRDVEPEVLLQLRQDDQSWQNAPAWDFSPVPTDGAP